LEWLAAVFGGLLALSETRMLAAAATQMQDQK